MAHSFWFQTQRRLTPSAAANPRARNRVGKPHSSMTSPKAQVIIRAVAYIHRERLRSLSVYPPVQALSRMGRSRMSRTTSLRKLSCGVRGMALPKQPQLSTHWLGISTSMPFSTMVLLPNGSQWSVYHVSQVKNSMRTKVKAVVSRGKAPTSKATPSRTSPMDASMPNSRAHGVQASRLRAPGSKYSSSLYMKPRASLILIRPETTNKAPTSTRQTLATGSRILRMVDGPGKFAPIPAGSAPP